MATARIGRLILLLLMPAATGCRPDATHGDAEDRGAHRFPPCRPPVGCFPPALHYCKSEIIFSTTGVIAGIVTFVNDTNSKFFWKSACYP